MTIGESILEALAATRKSPSENAFGIGAQTIAGMTPNLINPYGSTASNIGIVAGSGILSALLAGLARNEADRQNTEFAPVLSKFMSGSPEEQGLLAAKYTQLSPMYSAIMANQLTNKFALDQKKAELEVQEPFDLRKYDRERAAKLEDQFIGTQNDLLAKEGKARNPTTGEITQFINPEELAYRENLAKARATNLADREPSGGKILKPKEIADIELRTSNDLLTGNLATNMAEADARGQQVLTAIETRDPLRAAAAIYGMAKLLDEKGVVRKEDGQIVADPGGPAGQLASLNNQMLQKGRLTIETIAAMKELVPQLIQQKYGVYEKLAQQQIASAVAQGADPTKIKMYPKPDFTVVPIDEIITLPNGQQAKRSEIEATLRERGDLE